MTTHERIKGIMANVFGLAVAEIPDDASPDSLEQWNSLRHMQLVLALEEEFGTRFGDDQITQLINIDVIRDAIEAAGPSES